MKSQFSFESIGTWWEIDIEDEINQSTFEHVKNLVFDSLTEFDNTYSRFISSSLVNKMAHKPGLYTLPPEGMEMLHLYKNLYRLTKGAFTPLIGQTLTEAGYDEHYSFEEKTLSPLHSFTASVTFIDDKTIRLNHKTLLDFGGVGKGYAVDRISQILEKNSIQFYTINAGGDIFHQNALGLPLRVGMENPRDTKQVIGVVELNNESICSSAGNRRKWGKFHHIINPHTLSSPTDVLAVWVIAETTTIADSLATCLFLVKPALLEDEFKFNYFILYPDFSFDKSPGFKGKLFLR